MFLRIVEEVDSLVIHKSFSMSDLDKCCDPLSDQFRRDAEIKTAQKSRKCISDVVLADYGDREILLYRILSAPYPSADR